MSDRVPAAADLRIQLGVLGAVERDSGVTQRRLAAELGIAVGLVNAYIRRCVRKGLVKISDAPLNRYAYYLTPSGFAEKSRLTTEYLAHSFHLFRAARAEGAELLEECHRQGWRRVVLVGTGDLAEILCLSALEAGIEVVAVQEESPAGKSCAGHPVVEVPPKCDAFVVSGMQNPPELLRRAKAFATAAGLSPDRVLAPPLLGLVRPAIPAQATD